MKLVLINIKQLVTVSSGGKPVKTGESMRDLHVIENAAVMIEDDKISWIGRMEDLSMSSLGGETDILDCMERIALPGFVDAHTHAVFAGNRANEFGRRSAGATYAEITAEGGGILSTVQSVRETSKKDLKKQTRRYLNNMLRHGTTTVEIKSGYGLSAESELKMIEAIHELQEEEVITVVPTFLGAHAIPPEYKENRQAYIDEILEKMIPYIGSKQLAKFCDVFCEKGFFTIAESRAILLHGKQFGLMPKIHAEELSRSGGAGLAAETGACSADHLEHINDEAIGMLKKAGTVAVVLPGVSFFLNHEYAPARKLIDEGVPVAIASDFNPGSCMSYDMPLMMTIACTHMHLSPEEAITASTLNAAAAVSLSHEIGSIEVGKKADIILLNIPEYSYIPYHFGEVHVEKIIKNGVVLEI